MKKLFGQVCGAALGALLCFGCGAPAEEATHDDVGAVSQELGSWPVWSGPNFGVFDVGQGFLCLQMAFQSQVACSLPVGTSEHSELRFTGWGVANNIVPGGVKSIAVSYRSIYDGRASVYVLGNDNVVRYASGNPVATTATWYTGHFKTYYNYIPAKMTNGAAACIKKIAVIRTPSYYSPSTAILGLSCAGKIYVAAGSAGWNTAANAGVPWNAVPAAETFTDISHGTVGAYLLADWGRPYLLGGGTLDALNNPIYENRWILGLPGNLKATAVGGPYVITNAGGGSCLPNANSCPGDDKRVYKYDIYTNSWKIPTGLYMRDPQIDIGDPEVVPYKGIVDGTYFRNKPENFFVWHMFSQIQEWVP
jgi:hypothetical protein